MGRRIKTLDEYPGGDTVNEVQFNDATSRDSVEYKCSCGDIVSCEKRSIVKRLKEGLELICRACSSRKNGCE